MKMKTLTESFCESVNLPCLVIVCGIENLSASCAGIQCTNRYADICEAIASSDCSLVAQKYIGE